MSATVLYMAISPMGSWAQRVAANGLGVGGERLHEWAMTDGGDVDLDAIRRSSGVNDQVLDELMSTPGRSRQGPA